MRERVMDIPPGWENLDIQGFSGIFMVVGTTDVGKSTFAQYLYRRLCGVSSPLAYLDGDPGQSTLGPPSTMTLGLAANEDDTFPPHGHMWRTFVGSVSPLGHMLMVLTGAARLVRASQEAGVQVVIYDTTGLVDPARGGIYLKMAKIDLLRPAVLFALQRDQELEPLLTPLRRSCRVHVVELALSPAAQRRVVSSRQVHRAEQFSRYFANACVLRVNWTKYAVFPGPQFQFNHLVSIEDAKGFVIGLGIVEQVDHKSRQVTLYTPVTSLDKVDTLRLGDMAVDPHTFADRPLTFGTGMNSSF